MEFAVTYKGVVYPWQCDHMGHMNVMWYTGKFDEASWQLLSRLGLTKSRFAKERAAMAAVEQEIEYKRELRAGAMVTIRSAALEVRDKSIRLGHEMMDDESGEVAAVSTIVGVHLDAALRTARSIPSDVRELATQMMGRNDSMPTISEQVVGGPNAPCNAISALSGKRTTGRRGRAGTYNPNMELTPARGTSTEGSLVSSGGKPSGSAGGSLLAAGCPAGCGVAGATPTGVAAAAFPGGAAAVGWR